MASNEINHFLIPKHQILPKADAEKLLRKLGLKAKQMPQILKTDATIKHLKPEKNDIIKIIRSSPTAGKCVYYRRVVR